MLKIKISELIRVCVIGGVGFLLSAAIFLSDYPSYFSLLCIVPLTYGVVNIVCYKAVSKAALQSVSGIAYIGLSFIRCIVMPLLICIGGYYAHRKLGIEENMPHAIILFSYEIVLEHCLLAWHFRHREHFYEEAELHPASNKAYLLMFSIIVMVLLSCLILSPNAPKSYRTILKINTYEFTGFDDRSIVQEYAGNFFSRFGLVLYRYIFDIIKMTFPVVYLTLSKQTNRRKCFVYFAICLFFNLMFINGTIATVLINCLILYIYYARSKCKSQNMIKYFFVAGLGVVAFFTLRFSFDTEITARPGILMRNISNTAQAYFSGLVNIASGFNMPDVTLFEKAKYAIYEVLKGVPFATTIFRLDDTNIATLFNASNGSRGQIIPTISSASYYVGDFLAPIYPLVFLFIGLHAGYKMKRQTYPLAILAYINIAIYGVLGTGMYSVEITWSNIICKGLLILILSYIFEKRKLGDRK